MFLCNRKDFAHPRHRTIRIDDNDRLSTLSNLFLQRRWREAPRIDINVCKYGYCPDIHDCRCWRDPARLGNDDFVAWTYRKYLECQMQRCGTVRCGKHVFPVGKSCVLLNKRIK